MSWAALQQPEVAITPEVLAQLPAPDLALAQPSALVSYAHRRLRDAEVYFVFNSGDDNVATHVTLAGRGPVQTWNPATGAIRPVETTAAAGTVRVPLTLEAWGTTVLVVGGAARDEAHL